MTEDKNTRIYIGNLIYKTTLDDVKKIFKQFGEIENIQIKNGFSFVVNKF